MNKQLNLFIHHQVCLTINQLQGGQPWRKLPLLWKSLINQLHGQPWKKQPVLRESPPMGKQMTLKLHQMGSPVARASIEEVAGSTKKRLILNSAKDTIPPKKTHASCSRIDDLASSSTQAFIRLKERAIALKEKVWLKQS